MAQRIHLLVRKRNLGCDDCEWITFHAFFEGGGLAGGLLAYAADLKELVRRGAAYVDKILNGTPPSDLPVEQTAKYELFVNRKTAKALGLTIPQSVLVAADEVIE
jgi:ABC transporter substrate binding protein